MAGLSITVPLQGLQRPQPHQPPGADSGASWAFFSEPHTRWSQVDNGGCEAPLRGAEGSRGSLGGGLRLEGEAGPQGFPKEPLVKATRWPSEAASVIPGEREQRAHKLGAAQDRAELGAAS